MNTIYKKELKKTLLELIDEGFMGKEIIVEKTLCGCLMRLHNEGFKFSKSRYLQDYDDDCFFIDEPIVMNCLLHRITCDIPIEVKRRNDQLNTVLHFTHYTDGKHEAYAVTLI